MAYYHYDLSGQLDWVKDANNEQTTVSYGSDGHPANFTDPLGNTSAVEVDTLGRLTWIEDPIQAATVGTSDRTDIGYDEWGRQVLVTHPPRTALDPRHTTQFTYDAEGNQLSIVDERGKTVSSTYDAAGQITDTFNQKNENEHFTYNDRGWVTQLRNGRLKTRLYNYTDRGEVWEIYLPDATQESWSRDGNGNITQHAFEKMYNPYQSERINYTYDNANRLTLIDYLGAMTNVSFGYDNAGRQTSIVDTTGTSSWEYWLDGQVKKFISPQGTMRYDYNAKGVLSKLLKLGLIPALLLMPTNANGSRCADMIHQPGFCPHCGRYSPPLRPIEPGIG